MGLMRYWVFDRIWVETVDKCFCEFFDSGMVHSNVGMYFQNHGWQWVQSLNGMMSYIYLLYLQFQIISQFWVWTQWGVDGFVVDIQNLYNLVQRESFIFGDDSILILPLLILLWGCWFFLFYLATGKFHLWYEELWGGILEEFLLHQEKRIPQGLELWVQIFLVR